jgi:raffinose/stachyose/melibiose transport system substrate-binding protein
VRTASITILGSAAFGLWITPALAQTTLEFWTWNNEGSYVDVDQAAEARFEAAHPDVDLQVTYVPYADYMTKLKAALAAGEPPAIFQVPWDSGFRDLAASGSLEPMSTLLDTGFPPISESARDFVSLDGEVWALPLDLNTLQIAYNQAIFDELGLEPPTTHEELKSVAAALDEAGYFGISLGTRDKWAGGDTWFAQLVYTDPSGELLARADAGEAAWDDPAFVAAGDRVADLVAAGVFAPGANSMGAFNEALDLVRVGAGRDVLPRRQLHRGRDQ